MHVPSEIAGPRLYLRSLEQIAGGSRCCAPELDLRNCPGCGQRNAALVLLSRIMLTKVVLLSSASTYLLTTHFIRDRKFVTAAQPWAL
jgi:hypothetical protein